MTSSIAKNFTAGCDAIRHSLFSVPEDVAARPSHPPALPGPAALVRHVPSIGVAAQAFAEAGFSGVQYLKVGKSPCFTVDGVEMRELQLSATKG